MIAVLLTLLGLASGLPQGVHGTAQYKGHQVYRVRVESPKQVAQLQTLENAGADFWTEIRVGNVDLRVKPGEKEEVTGLLAKHGIEFSVMIQDLDELLTESSAWTAESNSTNRNRVGSAHNMDWTTYHPVEDMQDYMAYLENTYDFVSVTSIGKSYEGCDMQVLQVCRGGCGSKPAMWIDGGIHAREWVSPATVTFMMRELVEKDDEHPDLTQELDWYILPSLNPDGYKYTQTSDRLWRKTRSPNAAGCIGTDANRNWGYYWNTGGSSDNPCSDTYMGDSAFSEVENRNVRDFVAERKDNIKFFNTLHSYSQMVLLPWGFDFTLPDNYDDIERLALKSADALASVHGSRYEVGCIPCLLYTASGGSLDWALGEAGIPYSMGMELRDTGRFGFLLPPDQIIPTGEETWAFHLTAAREIIQEFGN